MDIKASLIISSRRYLSISHLSAAALFAHRATELESTLAQSANRISSENREHEACVITCIMLSVAFLEASINELWTDCSDEFDVNQTRPAPHYKIMGLLWKDSHINRSTMLEKFDLALKLNGMKKIPQDEAPYQNVKILVDLRNALIHYKPETMTANVDSPQETAHRLEKKLRGKFTPNQLTGDGNPFYPDKILGAGCATWALKNSIALTDIFYNILRLTPPYQTLREQFRI